MSHQIKKLNNIEKELNRLGKEDNLKFNVYSQKLLNPIEEKDEDSKIFAYYFSVEKNNIKKIFSNFSFNKNDFFGKQLLYPDIIYLETINDVNWQQENEFDLTDQMVANQWYLFFKTQYFE